MTVEKQKNQNVVAAVEEQPFLPFQTTSSDELEEVVLSINRCSKVVKGGRNFSFGALVVVGDKNGKVGYGYGKANEVSDAIRKGGEAAKKNMITVVRRGTTVPHTVLSKYRGSKVLIRPASEGTGLIAGGTMRAVLNLAGIVDVLAKSLGSSNPSNVVKATFKAIKSMQSKQEILQKRSKA
jgi:small subunit ribosomal protein S5